MDCLCVSVWEAELFPHFLSEPNFKPKTRLTFRAGLRCFSAWCLDHGITAPDAAAINRWKGFLLSRYQVATARTYLSAVKVFFRWLVYQGLGRNEAEAVRSIQSGEGFRKDCLSGMEMQQVLALLEKRVACSGKPRPARSGSRLGCCKAERALRDFVMVLLITVCGLRVSEVSSLDVGDLDTIGGEPVLWVHGKGRDGKLEFVPVPRELRGLLFQYLEKRRLFSRDSPMFLSYGRNSYGKRLSSRSISRVAKQAMVEAGFDSPRLTAHSLCHTAVTLALKGGATLQQVQQFARHRLIQTTLRYAHNLEIARNPCPRLVMKLIGRLDFPGLSGE